MMPALQALQARAETELGAVLEQRAAEDGAVETLSMEAEFRFDSAEQRELFSRALRDIVMAVVSKYTSPARTTGGEGEGARYRMIVGVYPALEVRTPRP